MPWNENIVSHKMLKSLKFMSITAFWSVFSWLLAPLLLSKPSINLPSLNQVFVQTPYRMKVCRPAVISCPIVRCHTATWWELCKRPSPHRRVCLPDSGFSHKLVPACLAATSEARRLSVYTYTCVVLSLKVSIKFNPEIKKKEKKRRGCHSLPVIMVFALEESGNRC